MKRFFGAIIVLVMATSNICAQDVFYSNAQSSCGCNGAIQLQSFPQQSFSNTGDTVYYNNVSNVDYSNQVAVSNQIAYPQDVGYSQNVVMDQNSPYVQGATYTQPESTFVSQPVYSGPNEVLESTINQYPQVISQSNQPVYDSSIGNQGYNEVQSTYATSNVVSSSVPFDNGVVMSEGYSQPVGTFTSSTMNASPSYSAPSYSAPSYSSTGYSTPNYSTPAYSPTYVSSNSSYLPVNNVNQQFTQSYSPQSGSTVSQGGGGSAQYKAQQAALMQLKGHVGGGMCQGAKFEGVGWSTGSAQDAIQRCCYWGTRPVAQIGTYKGNDGWYACVMYY